MNIHSKVITGAILIVVQFSFALFARGDSYTLLHSFDDTEGAEPASALTLVGSKLYGTTAFGGDSAVGTLFSVGLDGSGFQVLRSFDSTGGNSPTNGPTLVGSKLYGATSFSGSSDGGGTVYSVNLDGSDYQDISSLSGYGFTSLLPVGSRLFGTIANGGDVGDGAVFSVNLDGSDLQVLHSFKNDDGNGVNPQTGLTFDGTRLYGTTLGSLDGTNHGTVFSILPDGSAFATLHSFNGIDGAAPYGELALVGSTLYGTTTGGAYESGKGTTFSVHVDGSGFQTLHEFNDLIDYRYGPYAGLTPVGDKLYGTTDGTIFSMNLDGSGFQNVHLFSSDGSDGFHFPTGKMTLVGSTLYGTTSFGGAHGLGTIFSVAVPEPSTATIAVTLAGLLALRRVRARRISSPLPSGEG